MKLTVVKKNVSFNQSLLQLQLVFLTRYSETNFIMPYASEQWHMCNCCQTKVFKRIIIWINHWKEASKILYFCRGLIVMWKRALKYVVCFTFSCLIQLTNKCQLLSKAWSITFIPISDSSEVQTWFTCEVIASV